jgi:hypothetical protein
VAIAIVRDTSVTDPVPQPPGGGEKPKLSGCSWGWFEEKAARSAPPGQGYFRKSISLPEDRKIKGSRFILAVDNEATLIVNGQVAGSLAEWSRSTELDIAKFLKPGRNQLAILAVNATDTTGSRGRSQHHGQRSFRRRIHRQDVPAGRDQASQSRTELVQYHPLCP